jgi:hypothetical protein
MVEVFNIVILLVIFSLLFFSPLSKRFYDNIYKNYQYNIFDLATLNLVLFLSILLILSFSNIQTQKIFYFVLLISITSYIYNFKFFLKLINNKNIKKLLFFFIVFNFVIYINLVNNLSLGWDTFVHWLPKAYNFYSGASYGNLVNFHSLTYPHLGSYIWAFFWKNSLLDFEYNGRLFFVFIYLVSIFSISCTILNLKNFNQKNKFILIILFVLLIFFFSSSDNIIGSVNDHLFGGYQEVLIFSLLVMISKIFYIIKSNQSNNLLIFFLFICSSLLIWIKDEGLIYLMFILLIFILHIDVKKKLKFFYFFFTLIAIFIQIFIENYYSSTHDYFHMSSFFHASLLEQIFSFEIIDRSILIIKFFLISCLKTPLWIFIIFFVPIFLLYKKLYSNFKHMLTFLLLNIIFLFGVYIQTPHDLNFMLTSSMHRLLMQTSGFYILMIILCFNNLIKEPIFKNSINS